MSKSTTTANSAETLLKKLRRLDANMICPNCGTTAQRGIGFGNVCIKFKTFICDYCKSSHQAISHQVKSVTMSNWTMEEVNRLSDANSGGNAAALHIWLKNAPAYGARYAGGARPKPGDRIDVFKQFVLDCYEHGKFRANTPYIPQPAIRVVSDTSTASSAAASAKNSRVVSPVPGISPAPSVGDFDFLANSSSSAPPPPVLKQQNQTDVDFDPFSLSQNAVPPPAAAVAAPSLQKPSSQPSTKANTVHSDALIDLLSDDTNFVSPPSAGSTSNVPFDAFGTTMSNTAANTAAAGLPNAQVQSQKKSSQELLGLFEGISFDSPPAVTPPSNGLNRGLSPLMMQQPNTMQQPMLQASMMQQSSMMQQQQPPMMRMGAPMQQPQHQQYYGMGNNIMSNGNTMAGAGYMMGAPTNSFNVRPNPMAYSAQNTYQRPSVAPPQQQSSAAGSFDFLQETMKKHLDGVSNTSSASRPSGSKPINPFQNN